MIKIKKVNIILILFFLISLLTLTIVAANQAPLFGMKIIAEIAEDSNKEQPTPENVVLDVKTPGKAMPFDGLRVTKRDKNSNTYYNPTKNNYVVEIHNEQINYKDGNEFKKIDLTVSKDNCEFDYCMKNNAYHSDFKKISTEKDIVKFSYKGGTISYTPLSLKYENNNYKLISEVNIVEGYANNNAFIYEDIYGSGIDLVYETNKHQLKETIVIQDKLSLQSNLTEDYYLNVEFEIATDDDIYSENKKWDKTSKLKANKDIKIKKNGKDLFSLPQPYAIDSNNNRIELNYNFEEKNNSTIVSVSVPSTWLSDEERIYPIMIDPTTVVENVTLNQSKKNWGTTNYECILDEYEWSDNILEYIGSSALGNGDWIRYGALVFDVSYIDDNATVSDVNFSFYINNINDYACDLPQLEAYSMDAEQYDDLNSGAEPTGSEIRWIYDDVPDGNLYFDISSLDSGDAPAWFVKDLGSYGNTELQSLIDGSPSKYFMIGMKMDDAYVSCENDCFFDVNTNAYITVEYSIPTTEEESNLCNGTMESIVTTSTGSGVTNAKIHLNGVYNTSIENGYNKEVFLYNKVCSDTQNISLYCVDGSTLCETKPFSISTNNEKEGLEFDCSICLGINDIYISIDDVSLRKQGSNTNVSVAVHIGNLSGSDLKVRFQGQKQDTQISLDSTETISSFSSYSTYNVSVLWDISDIKTIHITADSPNSFLEKYEDNNYVSVPAINKIKAYLNVSTGISAVDTAIEEYLEQYVDSTTQASSEVTIAVGDAFQNQIVSSNNDYTLVKHRFKNSLGYVQYGFKYGYKPYTGLIGAFEKDSVNYIFAYGADIDGTITAVKRLVSEGTDFFTNLEETKVTFIDDNDIDAIAVYDYIHNDENKIFYRQDNDNFKAVVGKVLEDTTYDVAIKWVNTSNDNTLLKLKRLNNEHSDTFKSISNDKPVVLGHGLFGNIESMENLGKKIMIDKKFDGNYMRDTWLIEYTGGDTTECSTCPNYSYDDLIDYYWPALIMGVLEYSNQSSIDYVGYSTGGGVGIKSYEKYYDGETGVGYYIDENNNWVSGDLPVNFTDHMALIAPMGAFDGNTPFTRVMDLCGDDVMNGLSGKTHFNRETIILEILKSCLSIPEDVLKTSSNLPKTTSNISYEFFNDIVKDVQNKSDSNPSLSSINELLLIYGALGSIDDDGVIPDDDIIYMYNNSNTNERYKARVYHPHSNLPDKWGTYNPLTSKFLNDESYNWLEESIYSIESD